MRLGRIGGYVGSVAPAVVLVVVILVLAFAAPSSGATLYAANNGVDSTFCGFQVIGGFTCGTKGSPCRTIQCAIREAAAGDTVIVGPGRYGDLNNDGDQADDGDEFGSSGCGCMLSVNKALTVVSSHGAAATVIDARSLDIATNVRLILDGGEFGRPGKGFTVTNTKRHQGDGIVVDGANVKIRGNQVVATMVYPFTSLQPAPHYGINALSGGPFLIQGNQVLGQWSGGIVAFGSGKTVRNNQVSVSTAYGIYGGGETLVFANVVSSTGVGVLLQNAASAVGNSLHGNAYGIGVDGSEGSPFTGTIERNNIVGSTYCGLENLGIPALDATNNYWGTASGPGADPADTFCGSGGTIATPFATAPFPVNAPIKP